jgi:DNA processing protein
MSNTINFHIKELDSMKKYPKQLYYKGNSKLLNKRKVSIVGTRKPSQYTVQLTHKISNELSKRNICIVSGVAMGVDAIAHKAAGSSNTIAVVANGLDIRYPAVNTKLIKDIEEQGLILSAYKEKEKARNYTFVHRNEIVVGLGEVLIVSEADEKSGSLTSIEYALKMGKKVYTLPHRLGESIGTQKLVAKGLIEPIFDLENFLSSFGEIIKQKDELSLYLDTFPLYDEAIKKYADKIFELELEGKIIVENGYIKPT